MKKMYGVGQDLERAQQNLNNVKGRHGIVKEEAVPIGEEENSESYIRRVCQKIKTKQDT